MVEYTPGYIADHWCRKGHVLLCIEGELHTELQDGRTFILRPGNSYQVADGAEPHRSFTTTGQSCSSSTERSSADQGAGGELTALIGVEHLAPAFAHFSVSVRASVGIAYPTHGRLHLKVQMMTKGRGWSVTMILRASSQK